MKKFMKKFTIIITSILFVLQPFSNVVSAATVPPMGGIIAYTISNGNVNTYKSVNGAYSGYISGASDILHQEEQRQRIHKLPIFLEIQIFLMHM